MTDRPAILTARVEEITHAEICKNHLEVMDKNNRPSEATVNDVRGVAEEALHAVSDSGGSVAAVKGVDCPCVRLGADSCLSEH